MMNQQVFTEHLSHIPGTVLDYGNATMNKQNPYSPVGGAHIVEV